MASRVIYVWENYMTDSTERKPGDNLLATAARIKTAAMFFQNVQITMPAADAKNLAEWIEIKVKADQDLLERAERRREKQAEFDQTLANHLALMDAVKNEPVNWKVPFVIGVFLVSMGLLL